MSLRLHLQVEEGEFHSAGIITPPAVVKAAHFFSHKPNTSLDNPDKRVH